MLSRKKEVTYYNTGELKHWIQGISTAARGYIMITLLEDFSEAVTFLLSFCKYSLTLLATPLGASLE